MDNVKDYISLISSLSPESFDKLIVTMMQSKYRTPNVAIVNGSYDGGRDLVINDNIRLFVQLTVQKTDIEKKILEDVVKISQNPLGGRTKTLQFYCSQHISQSRIDKSVADALANYGVMLEVFDSHQLAQILFRYPAMMEELRLSYSSLLGATHKYDNSQTYLFDFLAMSNDAGRVKADFVKAVLMHYLYRNSPDNWTNICNHLIKTLGESMTPQFGQNILGKLVQNNDVIPDKTEGSKMYRLSDTRRAEIQKSEHQSQIEEQALIATINDVLARYGISDSTGEIADTIVDLFQSAYQPDYEKHPGVSPVKGSQANIERLRALLETNSLSATAVNTDEITKVLIQETHQNGFLNRYSASKMFTGLYRTNHLEAFLKRTTRVVYIDTPVLIYYLCSQIKKIDNGENPYQAALNMFDTISTCGIDIELHTTEGYVEEIVNHFMDAVSLSRFMKLPAYKTFGPSNNVFFRYVQQLIDRGYYDTFDEFLSDFLEIKDGKRPNKNQIRLKVRNFLDYKNIRIDKQPLIAADRYNECTKIYDTHSKGTKSLTARDNDLKTIVLMDECAQQENQSVAPYLVSWDHDFRTVRDPFKEAGFRHWQNYAPQRFANNLALANFHVNPEAVSSSLLFYVGENLLSEKVAFLDAINTLRRENELSEWKIFSKIVALRDSQDAIDTPEPSLYAPKPIDEMLSMLIKHYKRNDGGIYDIIELFAREDIADRIVGILKKYLPDKYRDNRGEINHDLISDMNKLQAELGK